MRLAELCDFASKLVKYGAYGRKRPKHMNSIILGGLFSSFCKCLYRIFKTGNLYRPSRDGRNGYGTDSRPAAGGGIDTADRGNVLFQRGLSRGGGYRLAYYCGQIRPRRASRTAQRPEERGVGDGRVGTGRCG